MPHPYRPDADGFLRHVLSTCWMQYHPGWHSPQSGHHRPPGEAQRGRGTGAAWLSARLATSPEPLFPSGAPTQRQEEQSSSRGVNSSGFSHLLSPEMSREVLAPAWRCIQGAPSVDRIGEGGQRGTRAERQEREGREMVVGASCRLLRCPV